MYAETQIVYSVCKISNTKHNVNLNCNAVRLSTRLISFKLEFPCLRMKMQETVKTFQRKMKMRTNQAFLLI